MYAAGGAQPYALVVTGAFNGTLTRTGAGGSGECAIVVAGKIVGLGPGERVCQETCVVGR